MPLSPLSTTVKPPSLELPPDRALVLHLEARAQPLCRVIGRLEDVTSPQDTHVASVRELIAFEWPRAAAGTPTDRTRASLTTSVAVDGAEREKGVDHEIPI